MAAACARQVALCALPRVNALPRRSSSRLPHSRDFSGRRGGHLLGARTAADRRQLALFALPSYKLARKSDEEIEAAAAAGTAESSGGRFPFKASMRCSGGAVGAERCAVVCCGGRKYLHLQRSRCPACASSPSTGRVRNSQGPEAERGAGVCRADAADDARPDRADRRGGRCLASAGCWVPTVPARWRQRRR